MSGWLRWVLIFAALPFGAFAGVAIMISIAEGAGADASNMNDFWNGLTLAGMGVGGGGLPYLLYRKLPRRGQASMPTKPSASKSESFVGQVIDAARNSLPQHVPPRERGTGPPPQTTYRTLDAWRERQRADKAERELADLRSQLAQTSRPRRNGPARDPGRQAAIDDWRWGPGDKGKRACFTYTDAWGEITFREIGRWRSKGPHIVGRCPDEGIDKSFRKDRIEDWEEL